MSHDSPTDISPSLKKGTSEAGVSFLDRRSWGLSHWLWLSILVALTVAFIPRGARRAIESNTNKAEDWLPENYAESADLRWFRNHFVGESFALVSWDGCTLGDKEKLQLLQQKLLAEVDEAGLQWFPRVVTGPETIESLTQAPANLDRKMAIARLEGALVGPVQINAAGESLGDGSRTTCLIAYLADPLTANNRAMRSAVDRIEQIAHAECGVPLASIRMGGPPVDNVTIDKEGEKTLMRLAGLSGIVGLVLSYLCFRSWKLTAMVFFLAVTSAGMSLAIVFYYGVIEVLGLGLLEPKYGKADAILMSMPAVVYVLGLSGAIHLVNYYRDERKERGQKGAAERAVRIAWGPCVLAAFTTAVGLGSLAASDILPIRKFGMFTAIGVIASVGLLFALLPVLLHGFPPSDASLQRKRREEEPDDQPKKEPWFTPLANFVTTRHALTTAGCLALMLTLAAGLPQIHTSVKLLKLLDPSCDLITDYEWLEQHLGNLVPMEVIVAFDSAQMRSPDEPAESLLDDSSAEGPATEGRDAYRMTLFERAQLSRRLQREIESLAPVSRALSATTFSPAPTETGSASLQLGVERTNSIALEEARDDLYEYLQKEIGADGKPTGRELWRISARVTALGDVDYGTFVNELRGRVEPLLEAYRARDEIVAKLHSDGKLLGKARVCVLFPSEDAAAKKPAEGSTEAHLVALLKESAGGRVKVSAHSTAQLAEADEATRQQFAKVQDALIALSPEVAATVTTLEGIEPLVLLPKPSDESAIAGEASNVAVYTGVVPLVFKTQRELLASLRRSIAWATVLIAGVMVLVLRSPAAGIASMIPNIFPIVTVFGTLGWLGIKVDIGIMMTASVALGVAVDDTLHFVTWFGRGIRSGLDRQTATRQAFERCATAMMQTTLIAGLGLAVFIVSTFTPTQQFGSLMITMLGTALIGDLILLPALLCGPLGRFFAPGAPAVPPPAEEGDSEVSEPTDSTEDLPAIVPFAPPVDADGSPDDAVDTEATVEQAEETLSPDNAALRKKLQGFRRSSN